MKKLLIILGTVFLAIILLVAVFVGVAAVRGSALDKESQAYVDRNLPLIISSWDAQELLSRASPEFTQNTTSEELTKDFAALSRKFGKMQAYEGSKGTTYINYLVLSSHNGKAITAVYTAKVTFANGTAIIKLGLSKIGDEWQIRAFYIDSYTLIRQ